MFYIRYVTDKKTVPFKKKNKLLLVQSFAEKSQIVLKATLLSERSSAEPMSFIA